MSTGPPRRSPASSTNAAAPAGRRGRRRSRRRPRPGRRPPRRGAPGRARRSRRARPRRRAPARRPRPRPADAAATAALRPAIPRSIRAPYREPAAGAPSARGKRPVVCCAGVRMPRRPGGAEHEVHVAQAAQRPARGGARASAAVALPAQVARAAVPDRDPHPAALAEPPRPRPAARARLAAGRRRRLPLRAQPAPVGRAPRHERRPARAEPARGEPPAAGPQRRPVRGPLLQPARRRVAAVPGARLDRPRQGRPEHADPVPLADGDDWPAEARSAGGEMELTRTREVPGGRGRPAGARERRDPLVGRLPGLRHDPRASPGGPRPGGRGPAAAARRRPAAGPRARGRDGGRQRQLVGRPVPGAHALRPRAQRDLRDAGRPPPRLGRPAPLRGGPPHQRGPDREDPHGRVDARDPAPPHGAGRAAGQLVRPVRPARLAAVPASDPLGHPQRHPRLAARRPRRALLAHRGVRGASTACTR